MLKKLVIITVFLFLHGAATPNLYIDPPLAGAPMAMTSAGGGRKKEAAMGAVGGLQELHGRGGGAPARPYRVVVAEQWASAERQEEEEGTESAWRQ